MLLTLATVLQIGVFGLFHPQRLIVKPVGGEVLSIHTNGKERELPGGRAASFVRHESEIDSVVGGQLETSRDVMIEGRGARPARFTLAVEGKIERRFYGRLRVTVRSGSGSIAELQPVLEIDLEDAVASTVAAEVPGGTHPEMLKAMAVLARSYYVASKARHNGFDFCDTTHCQFHRELPDSRSPAAIATSETRGLVLTFHDQPIAPLFFASCDGRTRTLAELGMKADAYPYYSVKCEHDVTVWSAELDRSAIELLDGTEAGRLAANRAASGSGRPIWPVKSNSYEIRGSTVIGKGEGHMAGFCQKGGDARARLGADWRSLVTAFFPGTALKNISSQ
ncbi:MAG TPA: SpoIID/LytB domain-containing protein [Bryobacteraceae bacterium]|nr:SpoIID/LytB domain-containing protein [Bryobacteraceae bacterium]